MSDPNKRRKREHQQHIKYILEVAESTFAEEGFFRTTMRQIALGTIYSYFGSKRQLYEKVIETKVNELVSLITKEMADVPSVQGRVKKFIHTKMTFLCENLSFFRLYLAELNIPRPDVEHILPKKVRDRYDSMLCDLTNVISQGIQEGFFKPMDAKVIAQALDGLTNVLALAWLGSAEAHRSIKTDMKTVTELFLHGALIRQEPTQNPDNRKESNNEP